MTTLSTPTSYRSQRFHRIAMGFGLASVALFLVAIGAFELWSGDHVGTDSGVGVMCLALLAQGVAGAVAIVFTVKWRRERVELGGAAPGVTRLLLWILFSALGFLLPVAFFVMLAVELRGSSSSGGSSSFGAWGRPLRIRGRAVKPRIRAGEEWTQGALPDVEGLDEATRTALANWWLQDARKEHASVPAFARLGWQLAALGAPADLLLRAHRSALEEIDHARRCFALVAGYSGRGVGVEPMPELLSDAMNPKDGLTALATESLVDGCFIEDLNSDAAELALSRATDPAVLGVLRRIVHDERAHAALSWDIVRWCLREGGARVSHALQKAAASLPAQGGGLYDDALASKVARADPAALRGHGRVPLEDWPALYERRLRLTRERLCAYLAEAGPPDRAAALAPAGAP